MRIDQTFLLVEYSKTGASAGQLLGIAHHFINDASLEIYMNGGRGEFNDKVHIELIKLNKNRIKL